MKNWKVEEKDSGISLLDFLHKKMESKGEIRERKGNKENREKEGKSFSISKRALKKRIEQNDCFVNGQVERFASRVLTKGEEVKLDFPEEPLGLSLGSKSRSFSANSLDISILYEDEHLFVCNKPSGLVSVGANSCESFFKNQKKRKQQVFPVHRLDKGTSGVYLFAKSKQMQESLFLLFQKQEMKKTYWALVDGKVKKRKGSIENYLDKLHSYQGQMLWGEAKNKKKGKFSKTLWKSLQVSQVLEASLLECSPQTGRTHQLRVHLLSMGHPILGDYQYNQSWKCSYQAKRYLLHAKSLEFLHPHSGERVSLQAALPEDFKEALSNCAITY